MQMLHQQKAAGQMQRDPSDMDANRVRPASPASADNAPSPSKRPRLDGTAPFNPNQGVMMPNGRPGQGMPGQQQVGNGPGPARALPWIGINPTPLNPDQLQAFSSAAPHAQAKTLATYSTNMSQHHGNQMPNRPVANPAGPQGQGSPMVPPGPDGNSLTQYYNPGDMGPGNMRPGAANGQATGGSNHALQDYQMQLMLLEQQNKKRLMMARQEQDMSTNNMPRPDGSSGGPGNVGGPGAGPPGPNAQGFQQGTSPPGGRNGASPNPSEQMKRAANQQMNNAGNMGSPLPDGTAQSRSSPNSMNYMGAANMDPNAGGQPFFKGVEGMNMNMAAQMNGAMRPPSSHPPFNGQMNQQQMMAAQRQAQQQQQQQQPGGAQGAPGMPGQWPQGGPNGQMAGQPPQPQQVQGNPTQAQRSMPPPSAPATAATTAAANATNARNTTASPQVSNAAPPTPQQAAKAAPKKKETKASKTKVSWHVSPTSKNESCDKQWHWRLTRFPLPQGCRRPEEDQSDNGQCRHHRCPRSRGSAGGPDACDAHHTCQPGQLCQEPECQRRCPGGPQRTGPSTRAAAAAAAGRPRRGSPVAYGSWPVQLLGSWQHGKNRSLPFSLVALPCYLC